MSFFNVKVTTDDSKVKTILERTEGALSPLSLSAFLREEGLQFLRERADVRFGQEGDDASGPWPALAWPTVQIRQSKGFPGEHPINVRTGSLKQWITSSRGAVTQTGTGAAASWPGEGTPLQEEKLATAQGKKRGVPARPVLAANELDLYVLTSGVAHWVADLAGLEIE